MPWRWRYIYQNPNLTLDIIKENPDKEWDQNEIEFFLVGDSFVLGNCVNRPNDISSVLRKLSNKSVLNIGYANNGPVSYTHLTLPTKA